MGSGGGGGVRGRGRAVEGREKKNDIKPQRAEGVGPAGEQCERRWIPQEEPFRSPEEDQEMDVAPEA